jgi:Putative zinc-finger
MLRSHPNEALLMAYRDNEISPREHARVENHLRHCRSCQTLISSLELGIGTLEAVARTTDFVDSRAEIGLLQLQDALETQPTQRRDAEGVDYWFELSEDSLLPLRSELGIYLGTRAAMQFLARAKNTLYTSQELVSAIQPLMSGLLGTESGAAVARRVAFLCSSSRPS